VEHLAVEHEPLRVQGALRLLHEKPQGEAATVTKNDVALAQTQSWFGQAVTVNQDQILER